MLITPMFSLLLSSMYPKPRLLSVSCYASEQGYKELRQAGIWDSRFKLAKGIVHTIEHHAQYYKLGRVSHEGQLLLGTSIGQQVMNNCTVHHMIFTLNFISLPFSLHLTLFQLLICPCSSPWVFPFPNFPLLPTRAEGQGSRCTVLSHQLGLNQDSIFWHATWAMRG